MTKFIKTGCLKKKQKNKKRIILSGLNLFFSQIITSNIHAVNSFKHSMDQNHKGAEINSDPLSPLLLGSLLPF